MSSAKEELDIFMNVLSRVGIHGDAVREFAKAKATLNGFKTQLEMNPPQNPIPPDTTTTPIEQGITPQPTQTIPQNNMPL